MVNMSPTKTLGQGAPAELDLNLPGWDQKQRELFFEGIKIHGIRKLKRLQRHIRSKTHEDIRIATELYKKAARNHLLTIDIEQQIDAAGAGVTNEEYRTWLYFYMALQTHGSDPLPVAALEAFLEEATNQFRPVAELTFPNWRQAEIKDFLATNELGTIIKNMSLHIPTKTDLEITAAIDAYAIICNARNQAIKHGQRIPTYADLKPGYIYLQRIVAALNDNEKMKKFKISSDVNPDMARAQFVLEEWLMPDVGTLLTGWTKDDKYALIVAIEAYGVYNVSRIQSYLPWKKISELKSAIKTIKKEVERKERSYKKSILQRYMSLLSWGHTLSACTKLKHQVVAAKRMVFALEELPEQTIKLDILKLFLQLVPYEEMSSIMAAVCLQELKNKGELLIPILKTFIEEAMTTLQNAESK